MEGTTTDRKSVSGLRWRLRLAGILLLAASWFIVTFPSWGRFNLIVHTIVFVSLGAFGLAAAALSRQAAVALERRLRLQLIVHNMELENMAMRDDLTQLFNRRYFFDRLERELETAKGLDRPLAIIVIDIDCLKAINDTYGHRLGDMTLAAMGRFLLEQARATDIPARIGGDEFAIILPDSTKRGAHAVAERLAKGLATSPLIDEDDLTLYVTASFGISGYPWGGQDVDSIIQDADTDMYAHKFAQRGHARPGPQAAHQGEQALPATFRRKPPLTDTARREGEAP